MAREALAEAEADLAAGIVPVDAMINAWLERYWRDLRIGGTHRCDMADTVYTSWANHGFHTGTPPSMFHWHRHTRRAGGRAGRHCARAGDHVGEPLSGLIAVR